MGKKAKTENRKSGKNGDSSRTVLFLSDNFLSGGLETHLMTYFRMLKSYNWRILFAARASEHYQLSNIDMYVDKFFPLNFPDYTPASLFSLHEQIENILAFHKVDFIHIHPFLCIYAGFLASVERRLPTVITLHGKASLIAPDDVSNLFLEEVILKHSLVFTVNPGIFNALKRDYNVHYLPNPMDRDTFFHAGAKRENTLLVVARLDEDKAEGIKEGIDFLLSSIHDTGLRIKIVGDGSKKGELERFFKKKPVEFLGKRESGDICGLMNAAKIVAGMGRVVLEAMATKSPAIIIGYDGCKGFVNQENFDTAALSNFNGNNLPPVNKNIFAREFKAALEGQFDTETLYKKLMQGYSADKIAFQYVSIVEDYLDKTNQKRSDTTVERMSKLYIVAQKRERELQVLAFQLQREKEEKNTLASQLQREKEEKNTLASQLSETVLEKDRYFQLLDEIYTSESWRVLDAYSRLREKSLLIRGIHGMARVVLRGRKRGSVNQTEAGIKNESSSTHNYRAYYKAKTLPRFHDKYDILFFSIIDWDFRFQRPQHFASRLAERGHRIFYFKTSFEKGDRFTTRVIRENIFEIGLPYPRQTTIYAEDLAEGLVLLKDVIKQLFHDFSIKESVSIVEFPMWYSLAKFVRDAFHSRIIFDILDEFSGFTNVHREVTDYERRMIDLSDHCLVSSELLYKKTKSRTNNLTLVRNGTEYNHFSNLPENDLLKDIRKPIIGYYGAISEWFDAELVAYVARKRPAWSIVLIGHTFGAETGKLKKLKNVHLLGEKPYASLPEYLFWFDVCLIPFKDIPLIKSTNPVKFYEYISAGKPVVATRLQELLPYQDIAYVSDTKEKFLENIETALNENGEKKAARKTLARENDWDNRVKEIEKVAQSSFPKVSIIIVTYNNLNYTRMCLESILKKTAYPNYEIIIVDNHSTDGTREYLQGLKGQRPPMSVIFNDENLGFARGNNLGISKASGSYIILLNNDTLVTRGWINGLLKHFDETVGMVGPVTNAIGNEAKIDAPYTALEDMDAFAEYYTEKHRDEAFEIKVLAMFCVAIRRELIEKIGLLDERYEVGSFEDDDYCLSAKKAGYRLLCAEDVFIHHFGGATLKTLGDNGYREVFEKNKRRFEEKWKITWEPHKGRAAV